MREQARHERQREAHLALYKRFAAGSGSPLAQPSTPELTGAEYYLGSFGEVAQAEDIQPPHATETGGQEPATNFLPTQVAADTSISEEFDPEAQYQDAQYQDSQYQDPAFDDEPDDDAQPPLATEEPLDEQALADRATGRKRRKRKRNLVMLATVLIFALIVAGSGFFIKTLIKQFNPDDYPGPGGAAVDFTVQDGWGLKIISSKLEERDVISKDKHLLKAVEETVEGNPVIHPGTYHLKLQMPAAEVAKELVNNRPDKVSYIGLKANMRLKASLEEIATATSLDAKELAELAKQPQKFGLPQSVSNLEGWLHPGEYRFPLDATAQDVLTEMVKRTKATLDTAGISDLEKGYRALKVASILQAEARPKDYATVAGAIENRLNPNNRETHGLLQVDSSVIYGLDRYSLQFTPAEKADASNKYNTYVHAGLPPTPIGSPAEAAIKAAAQPESNGYYYWVTVNIHTGETKFATTYAEHQRNQAEFRTWCSENPGVC